MTKRSANGGMWAEGLSRREFLRNGSLGCAALGVSVPTLAASASTPPLGKARSVILLWLEGGASPYETFAPHPPKRDETSPFGAIPTKVDELFVGALMPRMAGWMDRTLLFRAVHHADGTHAGATHLALTGRTQNADSSSPTLGELCAYGPGSPAGSVAQRAHALNTPAYPAAPHLALSEEPSSPSTLNSVPAARPTRRAQRQTLLTHMDTLPSIASVRQHSMHANAYGDSDFGRNCLAAREQVEAGAAFVQVTLSGWDRHAALADSYRSLVPQLDAGFSGLLADLQDRGLLEETLVVCMSEFGRSPRLNALGGRDHWPYAGCAVLAGSRLPGGQAVGMVGADGQPAEGAVSPAELLKFILARVEVPRPTPGPLV